MLLRSARRALLPLAVVAAVTVGATAVGAEPPPPPAVGPGPEPVPVPNPVPTTAVEPPRDPEQAPLPVPVDPPPIVLPPPPLWLPLPGRAVECDDVTGPVPLEKTVVAAGIRVHSCLASRVKALVAMAASHAVVLKGWGWRSNQRQIELRRAHCGTTDYAIWSMPSNRCSPPTARPGQSRHERGLAIDFSNCSTRVTVCWTWLNHHAPLFGLYNLPSEPWHWSVDGR